MSYLVQLTRRRQTLLALVVIALGALLLGFAAWSRMSEALASEHDQLTLEDIGPTAEQDPQEDIFGESATLPGSEAQTAPRSTETSSTPIPTIVVYITGAIRAPESYTLPANARVKDAVIAAGGLTADADAEKINMAARVRDEQEIHVPRRGEASEAQNSAPNEADGTTSANNANDGRVNINVASEADLDALSGIGKVLAQRIIEYRTTNGQFASIEDIKHVKGITEKVYTQIAPYIAVT